MKTLILLLLVFPTGLTGLTGCGSEPSHRKVLRVAMPPGRIADFERVLAPGFEEATGATIETLGMRSSDQVARLRIEKDNASMDVLWIDFGEAQLLATESLLAKVDESDLPNLREVRDEARSPAGIAPITFSSALGFLYNKERLPEPPVSWAELGAALARGACALRLWQYARTRFSRDGRAHRRRR